MNSVFFKRFKLLFLLLTLPTFWTACNRPSVISLEGRTMGTSYHVQIVPVKVNSLSVQKIQTAVDSLLTMVNKQMSTYLQDSEISRFNRMRSVKPFKVSPSFLFVVKSALQIYKESDGAFDITVGPLVDLWGFGKKGQRFTPPDSLQIRETLKRVGSQYLKIFGDSALCKSKPDLEIDLSAIAKGYGVDAVSSLLRSLKFRDFMVEIGGEVFAAGSKQGRPWRIGIDRPQYGAQPGVFVQAILNLQNRAVATSGDYRNFFEYKGKIYSHEIDPRTGFPVSNNTASVTVIAPDCMTADAMATAIMVMGAEKGLKWVNSKKDTEAFILLRGKDGKLTETMSSNFDGFIAR